MEIKRKLLLATGFCLMLFLFSNLTQAETMYVTDVLKLALRSDKGSDQNIIAVVTSGQIVEVFQIDDNWARVSLPNGKEGWVLSRYLTPRKTHGVILESLEKNHKALKDQLAEVLDENSQLTKENKRLLDRLKQLEISVEESSKSFENLKTEAAGYLDLKTKFERTVAQFSEQAQKSEKLKEEIERLETRQMIRWFLTGAGVLLFGIIIGFSAKRQRRKSSLRV
ncbi:MAG: TIGR04211 family SH3 domain-containing protein [Deltaproteobacteria bacterium]|nr:MAG: TIGR04211 family SH3 domain-containing protein [Deltaproteobacteria bacterium]